MMTQREIVRLRLNEGDEIVSTAGAVWLTFGGHDFVLKRGQSFFAPARGEVMLQGLGATYWDFRWAENSHPIVSRSWGDALRTRIARWFSPTAPRQSKSSGMGLMH